MPAVESGFSSFLFLKHEGEDRTQHRKSFRGMHSELVGMNLGRDGQYLLCKLLEWLGEMYIILKNKWIHWDYVYLLMLEYFYTALHSCFFRWPNLEKKIYITIILKKRVTNISHQTHEATPIKLSGKNKQQHTNKQRRKKSRQSPL